jgi:superfamily I DNA/RNA helicase
MAVLCRKQSQMDDVARVLQIRKLPHKVRKSGSDFDPLADTIKVMTMHASKGLEFPVVARLSKSNRHHFRKWLCRSRRQRRTSRPAMRWNPFH